MISVLLNYALITAAMAVDDLKRESNNDRTSLLEDNLIVWRIFPLRVVKTFPDFVMYLREICCNKNYAVISQ